MRCQISNRSESLFRCHCLLALLPLGIGSPLFAAMPPWAYPQYNRTYDQSPMAPQPASQQYSETSQPLSSYWYQSPKFRPQQPRNSSGNPTNYSYRIQIRRGDRPYQQGPQTTHQAPTLETIISERRPVVQQNLVFRVRIHSSGNLKEATPKPPATEAVIFRQLGQPLSYASSGKAGNTLVTEYSYLLIPLAEGEVILPPFTVSGKYTNNTPFEVTADHSTTLYVQPAKPNIQPWLPLYDLQLEARLPEADKARAGEPLTLEIITTAIGAVGNQLPSVTDQLVSDDFYIYPGKVVTDGKISADGLDLLGSRIEKFTLVPRYGGRLTLPDMALRWWNLRTGQAATATLPLRQFQVTGSPNPDGGSTDRVFGLPAASNPLFWVPLLLVAILVFISWLKVLLGDGKNPIVNWIGSQARQLLGDLYQPLAALALRFSPRRHFHRLRTWIGRNLPVSWKLWYCLRAVDREEDPATWGQALQILAAKHLGARPHASLQQLGRHITACHPNADAQEVVRLMADLDQAIYGGQSIAPFAQWKDNFKAQIKPRLFPIRFRECKARYDRSQLPNLNPTI